MYHGLLIVLQFVLAGALVLSTRWSPLPWLALVVSTPGIALAIRAWFTMGLRRLRIHPTTNEKTRLVTNGPYGIVRHPMYTGLLWFTAGLLMTPFSWWRVVAWIVLLLVLVAKTREEESAMSKLFPAYDAYRRRVGGLVPKVLGRLLYDQRHVRYRKIPRAIS